MEFTNPHHRFSSHLCLRWKLRSLLPSNFHGIYLHEVPAELHPSETVIMATTHTSWWDDYLVYLINRHSFNRDFFTLMAEEKLTKNPRWGRMGGIPIAPAQGNRLTQSLHYLTDILNSHDNLLLNFFPQGGIVPDVKDSYEVRDDLTMLKPRRRTWIFPLYLRYEAGPFKLPLLYAVFGSRIFFDDYRSNASLLPASLAATRKRAHALIAASSTKWNTLIGKDLT